MPRPKPYTKPGTKLTANYRRDLSQMVATTRDGRDITRPWISGLREPRDPRLLGSVDWGIYDRILMDDQVMSTLQQRVLAVISYPWNVLAGDEDDPRSVEAAVQFKKTMNGTGVDNLTRKMLAATFYGVSVAELLWQPSQGSIFDIMKFKVRHARRFRFDDDQKLRLLTMSNPQGERLSDRKFWVMRSGGTDDDEDYGRGLAEWLYWPTLFKRNGIGFWNIFLDKFGSPTAKGTYRPGTPQGDIEKLLAALQSMATDSGFVVPEGMAIELLEAARSGTGDYEKLCRYMDEAIAKVVLSQTMTTQDGSSLSQAQVHAGVKLEVVKADADLLSDSFNEGPARWWTDFNYGPDVASPRLVREIEEEADLKAMAETDTQLDALGWVRTDESFKATFGEGYERKPAVEEPPKPGPAAPGGGDRGKGKESDNNDPENSDPPASFAANDPRPLYVYRSLLNSDQVIAWAREQGLQSTVPGEDMHVTITYSRRPVNWLDMGGLWGWNDLNDDHRLPPGGPRIVETIGDKGAVALFFFSGHLEARNREMRDAGASWDFADYFSHITLTYDAGDIDLSTVEPYRGELLFGPEIFEPLEEDWAERLREVSFAAPDDPAEIDALVDELIESDGFKAIEAMSDPLFKRLAEAQCEDDVRAILADGLPDIDIHQLKATLENPMFALALDEAHREAGS